METQLDAAVVGGGWAGLSVSAALQAAGLRHLVLEKRRICETWRMQRWDSFRMNTTNALTVMPGARYGGDDPDGFMTRDAFVAMVEGFAARRSLPVETGRAVTTLERYAAGGFVLATPQGVVEARNVVIASGNLNVPKRPASAAGLPDAVLQLDASDYRSAGQLPPGAVLVVGAGNSGGQIAEDLARAGRPVFLATGRNGRVPRRYRNRDILDWLIDTGRMEKPRTAATGRPLLGATHTISLQSLSALGVVMLGRFLDAAPDGVMTFADDLAESAAFADQVSADIKREIDDFIAAAGLSAPVALPDEGEAVERRFPDPPILALDLAARGIATVIWSIGFRGDYGWVLVPGAIDDRGEPVQQRGISVPGVYFAGLDTSDSLKAGTVMVAAEESDRIVGHILKRGGA